MSEPYAYDDYPFLPDVRVTGIESSHFRDVVGDFGWKGSAVHAMPGGHAEIFTRGADTLELGWAWAPDDSSKAHLISPMVINDKEWHISSIDDVTHVLEEDQRQAQLPEHDSAAGGTSEITAIAATVDRSVGEEVADDRLAQENVEVADLPEVKNSQVLDSGLRDNPTASVDAAATIREVDHESGGSSSQLSHEEWGYRTFPTLDSGLASVNAGESEIFSYPELETATEVSNQLCYEAGGELDPEVDM